MWTVNFQKFKPVLEKAEEPQIKLPTYAGSSKKHESSRKTSTFALLTVLKPLTVWIITNWKMVQEMGYQTTWPASWEICLQIKEATVRIGHGITDWFQIRKGVHQGCILSPCLFNLYAEWKWSRSVVSYSLPPCGSLPGSPVHRIFQARILEWVAISFSRGSSQPRDRIWVSHIVGRRFTVWATRKAKR